MARDKITTQLHRIHQHTSDMIGSLDFENTIEIDNRFLRDQLLMQRAKDQLTTTLIRNLIEWLKDNFPEELEIYINMEAKDQMMIWRSRGI